MQVDCGAERVLALERVPQMVRLQVVFVRLEGKRLHGSVASKEHARSLAIAPATDKVRPVSTGFDDDGKQMPTMSLTRPTAKCSRSAAASLPLAVRRPRTSGSASLRGERGSFWACSPSMAAVSSPGRPVQRAQSVQMCVKDDDPRENCRHHWKSEFRCSLHNPLRTDKDTAKYGVLLL